MRELSWKFGKAWIAATPDEWPIRLPAVTEGSRSVIRSFDAPCRPTSGAIAVMLNCQTGSGGSFLTIISGQLTVGGAGTLRIQIKLPADSSDAREFEETVFAGIESVQDRPYGVLEISRFVIHPVDFKRWANIRTAAILCRLFCEDIASLSDTAASAVAAELAQYRPSERL